MATLNANYPGWVNPNGWQPAPYTPVYSDLNTNLSELNFVPPPWVNDDMLDQDEAKKLYEYITREKQDNFPLPITGEGMKKEKKYVPHYSVVKKTLAALKNTKIFSGGNEEEWENVKKLAETWHEMAVAQNTLSSTIVIKRVDKKYVEDFYPLIAKAWTFRPHGDYSLVGDLAGDAYQVVKDAIREKSEKKAGLASIEFEVLKLGGMILGTHAENMNQQPSIIVYFESYGKSVMDKLLGDGKEKKKKARIPNIGTTPAFYPPTQPYPAPVPFTPIGIGGPSPAIGIGTPIGIGNPWINIGGSVLSDTISVGGTGGVSAGYNTTIVTNNVTKRYT